MSRPKKPQKEGKTAVLYVRLTESMKARVAREAQRLDITETQAARRALTYWLTACGVPEATR